MQPVIIYLYIIINLTLTRVWKKGMTLIFLNSNSFLSPNSFFFLSNIIKNVYTKINFFKFYTK